MLRSVKNSRASVKSRKVVSRRERVGAQRREVALRARVTTDCSRVPATRTRAPTDRGMESCGARGGGGGGVLRAVFGEILTNDIFVMFHFERLRTPRHAARGARDALR